MAKQALESGAMKEADNHVTAVAVRTVTREGWLLRGILPCSSMPIETRNKPSEQAKQAGAHSGRPCSAWSWRQWGQSPEAVWSHVAGLAPIPDDEECMHWMLKCGTLLHPDVQRHGSPSFVRARNPGNIGYAICSREYWVEKAGRRADAQREYDRLRAMVPTFEARDGRVGTTITESERPSWYRTMPHEPSPALPAICDSGMA